ncbi:MAG: DUF5103 domain-containing protein [Bacteroidia bacterium]|nr:DUF5103 domain-containing protein [Bacteroidia bacterium]|tara:strand:+ start:4738 stop:6000 length:1263 start_codon:yes stop_codon:yes gene_type:complete
MKKVLLFLFLISFQISFGQRIYDNTCYDDKIATVILQKNIDIYDPVPIINLGSSEALKLSFDMLDPQNEFLNYSLVHCDRNWMLSDLQPMDYVSGNTMGEITDYKFSTNTYQTYTHYSLNFPSDDMAITKSGNYILKVFRNFDEEDILLTRRFMVVDPQTKITTTVKSATIPEFRFTHQEIDFTVNYLGFNIPNPFLDVHATILQNNSWSNAIRNLKPQFVNNNELSFNYENENIMSGTNEFRFFDIRSLRFFSNNVIKKYIDTVQNVVLRLEESKAYLNYVRWIDYNGKRDIFNSDGMNLVEDGDYVLVHFNFKSNSLNDMGEIFVYGELSDWQTKDKFKMTYSPELKMYTCSVLLKQSYYNYHFVLRDKDEKIDYTFTEGNHQETENDYTILLYHKNIFYGYDEIIGLATRNSNTLRK